MGFIAQRFISLLTVQRLVTVGVVASLALSAAACGGDSGEPDGVGKPVTPGPSSPNGNGGEGPGPTTPNEPTPSACGGVPDGYCQQDCLHNSSITTFLAGNYTQASSPGGDRWGDPNMTLTGEAFSYAGTGITITRTQTETGMRLETLLGDDPDTADVTEEGYSGFGVSFGPCVYGATYRGIQFNVQGLLGDETNGFAEFQVQLQSHSNYPIDAGNKRGNCAFASESSKWSDCTNNAAVVDAVLSADEPVPVELPWELFTGGTILGESGPLKPEELLGIQFQFNCASAERCAVDLVISDLKFLE